MSLSLRDECRIVLRPDSVVLAHLRRELTRLGLKRHVLAERVVPCDPPGDERMPWAGALKALEENLPEFAGGKSYATVILSNHFMRYTLVPWSDVLSDETEEIAYARHSFNEVYGRDAGEWELRISSGSFGMPQLASAVDARLPAALRDLFGRHGIGLSSIQPHLMVAYNACHASLRGCSAWLALVEEGSLCLALLQEGQWAWVRTMRIGNYWRKELPFLLSREALIADTESCPNEVLLWAPDCRDACIDSSGKWRIQPMQSARVPGFEPLPGGRSAMNVSE